jgi:hypothetical protein
MRVAIYLVLLVLATGTALLFGTRGEKWVGTTVLAGNLLTMALEHAIGEKFASVFPLYLALDAGLAIALCVIAVRYPSWVAICVAAFQVNGTLGHLVKLVAIDTIPFSYAFLLRVWAWPMVLALLAARFMPSMRSTLLARDWPLYERQAAR